MNEKKALFNKLFPDRAEKLRKSLQVLSNCSNKYTYEFNKDLVTRVWIELGKHFRSNAKKFGVDFQVIVNGIECDLVDTKEPLNP